MAISGDLVSKKRYAAQLLTNQTAVDDGEWIDISRLTNFSVHAKGISGTDRVQVRVSNDPTRPLNTVHDAQLGSDLAAESIVGNSQMPFRWLKAMKSAADASPGTTNVYLYGEIVE